MKVSEITVQNVADYLRLDDATDPFLSSILSISKQYISNYTGIPITSTDTTIKTLDDYEDFHIVVLVLCQDMFDNRALYVDKTNLNKVVDSILGMHCTNLLPTPDEVTI
ncbi:head-tail connector protein [Anaerosacchariphilus polymeriproducens]|uniref:Phage gp6-like head-tail connector protein n=1 Tax=Anaerosacchariphilus polymeriproducens TaxID=1812858 RepID=A0A371AT65_9FIRM|nr:head-tail connector protein [Anaerosacchariphilus polymeriproducens]RDU22763.1 phage gp6-like head-tail connector protein [Anaerosacchariphilus polymeriproducens]